jgi:ADP-ribose pyrophosphatase
VPIVFKSRVFSVDVDTRTWPGGTAREVTIVRHRPSVVIVPVDGDGRVVLVRQYRASVDRVLWELPAGGVNEGETPEEAVERECEEEIGAVPGRIERVRGLYPAPGFCDEELIFFRVSDLRPPAPDSTRHADEDEDIEVCAVTVDDARAMVARGDIVDLKTAYGLTLL